LCAQASHGDYRHIAWATSKFTPNLFVTRKDKLMTITPPARSATPRMRTFVAPLLLAAAGAVAIAVAPMAEAATTAPECTNSGDATICQTEGNTQVVATPPAVDYQAQYPFSDYGGLLFHGGHRG
jgi:hypothetical protein